MTSRELPGVGQHWTDNSGGLHTTVHGQSLSEVSYQINVCDDKCYSDGFQCFDSIVSAVACVGASMLLM